MKLEAHFDVKLVVSALGSSAWCYRMAAKHGFRSERKNGALKHHLQRPCRLHALKSATFCTCIGPNTDNKDIIKTSKLIKTVKREL